MVLTTGGDRVQGFSGCNKFTGNYQRTDGRLHLEPLASTRMACITGMEQEKRFLDALESTVRYSLNGESLSIYDRHDQLILRFESVYWPQSSACRFRNHRGTRGGLGRFYRRDSQNHRDATKGAWRV